MKVAVFGCLHGQLNDMFNTVSRYEEQNNCKIDLIVVCGDCQTIRHQDDLRCLAVPNKYKRLGDFHEYYSGQKKIPWLTIFIGGNHEASNYLMTLPYGGWVCDNFYYLGFAGVVNYKGLRIGGVSGIYNYRNCNLGRFERMPLDNDSIRSIYHTRRVDIFRLQLLSRNITEDKRPDIFLSHDWPARVYDHGDLQQLLRFKPLFRADVSSRDGLGSPLTQPLIDQLKPRRWFAAHLHCRFSAKVNHGPKDDYCTEFLSLNKIEKGRKYVEYLDLEAHSITEAAPANADECSGEQSSTSNDNLNNLEDNDMYYDPEWLTILRKTISLEVNSRNNVSCPSIHDDNSTQPYIPTPEDIQETIDMMEKTGGLRIKKNFCMTEPVIYDRPDKEPPSIDTNRNRYFPNPQHIELCTRLNIEDQIANGQSIGDAGGETGSNNGSHYQRRDYDQRQDRRSSSYSSRGARSNYNSYNNNNIYNSNQRYGDHTRPGQSFQRNDFGGRDSQSNPIKKRALELDEDGCLPYYVDKKGDC